MDANDNIAEAPFVSVVDDDISVRRSTRRLLLCSGLRAEAFASADEFLRSGLVGQTDCLLLDIRMPDMDGLALQQHLADTGRRMPIVFLSARASDEEESRAWRAGAVDFLRKPVSTEKLLQAIHTALRPPNHNSGTEL